MANRIGELRALITDKPFETWFMNYAGEVCSQFLVELRDNKRIMGTRCPKCNRVLVPARPTCARCFAQTKEWVQVSDTGTLLTYTTLHEAQLRVSAEPPIFYGVIQLDGSDTGLVHLLGEVDPKDVHLGMKLRAVFSDERMGDIGDIKYFKPVV